MGLVIAQKKYIDGLRKHDVVRNSLVSEVIVAYEKDERRHTDRGTDRNHGQR